MTKDKERIEQLAEGASVAISRKRYGTEAPIVAGWYNTELCANFLAAYLAERGKEATSSPSECREQFEDWLRATDPRNFEPDAYDDQLYKWKGWKAAWNHLAPQPAIPEGMPLVPIDPTVDMYDAVTKLKTPPIVPQWLRDLEVSVRMSSMLDVFTFSRDKTLELMGISMEIQAAFHALKTENELLVPIKEALAKAKLALDSCDVNDTQFPLDTQYYDRELVNEAISIIEKLPK